MRVLGGLCVLVIVLGTLPATVAAQAQPTVAVQPAAGPYGTEFQPRATGLPAGIPVIAVMRFPTGEEEPGPTLDAVPPGGEWLPEPWFSEAPEPLGRYTVLITSAEDGTVLASGSFTVTAGPAPAPAPAQVPR